MSETITKEEFKAATDKLLKEELQNVLEFDKEHDPSLAIAIAGLATKCYKKLELELFN